MEMTRTSLDSEVVTSPLEGEKKNRRKNQKNAAKKSNRRRKKISHLPASSPPRQQVLPVQLVPVFGLLALPSPHAEASVMRGTIAKELRADGALVAVGADDDGGRDCDFVAFSSPSSDRSSVAGSSPHARHRHAVLVLFDPFEAVAKAKDTGLQPRGQLVDELVPGEVAEAVVPLFEDAAGRVGAYAELSRVCLCFDFRFFVCLFCFRVVLGFFLFFREKEREEREFFKEIARSKKKLFLLFYLGQSSPWGRPGEASRRRTCRVRGPAPRGPRCRCLRVFVFGFIVVVVFRG